MRWWCAATNAAWTWEWKPYIGVWVLVAVAVLLYRRAVGRAGADAPGPDARRWYYLALASLWLATDWPLGALAGGYLVSAHTAQYILLSFVTAPLLVLGTRAFIRPSAVARAFANPLCGWALYTAILGLTHVPAISDALMATQWGSFLIDMAWIAGGWALWWPVLAPEGIGRMSPLGQIGYLFVQTIIPTVPSAILTFADYPKYKLYELAPRIGHFSAAQDQQLAGLSMKLVADPFIWVAMAIIFVRWYRAESKPDPLPGDPQPTS